MITTERIAELRTILNADLLDQGTAFYMACDDLPSAIDTIEAQQRRIRELEAALSIKIDDARAFADAAAQTAIERLATSAAARDVLAERQRQIEVEGWNVAHDDQQPSDNLVMASVSYALASVGERTQFRLGRIMVKYWPWAFDWWKPKDRRRDKVRSAALMLAAIEHDDRATAAHTEGVNP